MARLIFPSDRLVYRTSTYAGSAFTSDAGAVATVYSDAAGTTLADVQNFDGTANSTATFTVDTTSRLPLFLGPASGADTLYIKVGTGPVTAIYAVTAGDISAAIGTEAASRIAGDATTLAAAEAYTDAHGGGVSSVNTRTGAVTLAKADVGLGNVDNTSDVNKPVSTAQATADALALQKASNLSDVANAGTARTNLGLGAAALLPALTVQDENTNVSTSVTQIDFQGAGVTASAGTGEVVVTIPGGGLPSTFVSKTANYTAAAGEFVEADTSSAGFTATLPSNPAVGTLVAIQKVSSDTNTLTIAAAGSGTIAGSATMTTITQWAGVVVEHKGSDVWRVAASMSTTGPAGTNGTNGINGTNGAISVIQDEGTPLTVRSALNFIGASVTATDDAANGRTNVTVTATSAVVGMIPRALASGRYYGPVGQVATLTMGVGVKYCVAFEVFASTSFTAIGLNVSTAIASAVIRLGVYNSDPTTGLPSTLVFDAGSTIDASTTGNKEIAISQTLTAGVYWLAARATGAGPGPYAIQNPASVIGSTTQAGAMQNAQSGYGDAGGGSGALDSTWGSTYQTQPAVPKIVLKTA